MERVSIPHAVIFINYRQTDAGWPADRLADKLRTVFGEDRVFLDVRSVEGGQDFAEEIRNHLERAAVLIVLIGESWLLVHDQFGRRRLDDRDDWVRREIRTALACKGCKVIPVLLDDATLPNEKQALPRDIADLLVRQRIHLRRESSEEDIERLIDIIEKSGVNRLPSTRSQPAPRPNATREVGIKLRISPWTPSSTGSPRADATSRLSDLIKAGQLLLDAQQKQPASSPQQLDSASGQWHDWRKYAEQSMVEFFSPPKPLDWLQELRPRHLDFNTAWDVRARELPRDIERELAFFQNLLFRLENYDEETGGSKG
jgi:hypothetical protein